MRNLPHRVATLGLTVLVLSACAASPTAPDSPQPTSASSTAQSATAQPQSSGFSTSSASAAPTSTTMPVFSLTSPHGKDAVHPQDSLQLTVENGKLAAVEVVDSAGKQLTGTLNGSAWTPTRPFAPKATYTVNVTMEGSSAVASQKFQTVSPAMVVEVDFRYADGSAGNGMPIWARFDLPVKDQTARVAIMNQAKVTTVPAQEGAWGWADERTMYWRPKDYWAPGSTAHVEVNAAGIPVGETWIASDVAADYSFGNQRVLKGNIDTHSLEAWENGALVNSFNVSYGKPGDETMTGTKVIMEKLDKTVMDSSSYGVPTDDPNGYKVDVFLAQRITWSGEFIHAAPWSEGAMGAANVSHGCTGLSDADAQWLFNWTMVGDPAEFVGSTKATPAWDTIGVWTYSWADWQGFSDGRLAAPKAG